MEFTNVFNQAYILGALASNIYPKLKIEILDRDESVLFEITQNISKDSAGQVSINYGQGVRRSCSITLIDVDGSLIPNAKDGLFWIGRKFKIYTGLAVRKGIVDESNLLYGLTQELQVLYNNAPTSNIVVSSEATQLIDTYWFSQGVFYITNPSAVRDFSRKTVTINGVDKFGIFGSELGGNQIEGTYVIPTGTNIYAAIRDILTLDMGNGFPIDPIAPFLDPLFANEFLPYDINKSPGSYLGEILIEIATVLGCDIFYDINGQLQLIKATQDVFNESKASIWEYSDALTEYSNSSLNFDFTNAINVVKVIADNINGKIIEYTAENNNYQSSTRIELIGRKILPLVNSSYIYDQQRAKEYAEYVLNIKSIVQTTMNFNSSFLPHLDVNNIIGITDKYFGYERQRFVINGLTIPLSTDSQVSVSASNISELPYFDA
jgi:hypothetical protein